MRRQRAFLRNVCSSVRFTFTVIAHQVAEIDVDDVLPFPGERRDEIENALAEPGPLRGIVESWNLLTGP